MAQDDIFAFDPLLMPFPAGEGTVINGYDDGERHHKGDRYGLDLCDADGCQVGDEVLAPTALTLVYSGDYNNTGDDPAAGVDDPDDFHIFEIDRTESGKLCLSLAHFDLTADDDGTRTFIRGEKLGALMDYRDGTATVPHYHISLWTVASEDGCAVRDDDPADPKRFALPFVDPYELDGQAFPKDEDHEDTVVTSTNGAGGSTPDPTGRPPVDKPPAPRPEQLPARVPWTPGEAHGLLSAYDPDAPEGQGLVFAGTRDSVVYPLFAGDVVYAGCGTGRSAPLGLMVVVRTEVEGKPRLAVYGHLSAIEPDLIASAPLSAGRVEVDDPIGRFGATVTGVPFDDCTGTDGGPDRLYVGLLRGATVSSTGEIAGGRAVYPEPLVGLGAYEGFRWWAGNPTAIDPVEGTGTPRGKWANKATPDGATVDFGDPVTLIARVKDGVPIREVRFTAWYPDWVRPKPLERLAEMGFDQKSVWRILAVCRPNGVTGEPNSTPGCRWDGSATEAVVRFDWDPTAPVNQKITPWQPLSRVAIAANSPDCVPVSLSFDIYDAAGYRALSPDGVKRYERCRAATDKPGKVVNLEPPKPPEAPANVRLVCWQDNTVYPGGKGRTVFDTNARDCLIDMGEDRATLRWEDRADNEDGYRVYARYSGVGPVGSRCNRDFVSRTTNWTEVAELPPDREAWRVDNVQLGPYPSFRTLGFDVIVVPFNEAGEPPPGRFTFIWFPNPEPGMALCGEPGVGKEWRRYSDAVERYWAGER